MDDSRDRLAACEHSIRQLRRSLVVVSLVAIGVLLGNCATGSGAVPGSDSPSVLRVSELVIVDAEGTERVRIGTNLPDAVIGGRTVPRGSSVAGIMLYDDTGQERSGYVTENETGNVLLTLDSRERQTALFVADTSGATALRIWDRDGAVDLRSDSDGARVTVVRDGIVAFQQPGFADPVSTPACRAYREYLEQLPREQIVAACQERMPAEACQLCLAP